MLHVVSLSSSFSSSNTLDFDTPANLFYILNLFYFCLLLPIWLSFWLSLEHIIMLPRLATNNLVSVLTVKAKRTKINKFYIKKILYSVNTLMSQLHCISVNLLRRSYLLECCLYVFRYSNISNRSCCFFCCLEKFI